MIRSLLTFSLLAAVLVGCSDDSTPPGGEDSSDVAADLNDARDTSAGLDGSLDQSGIPDGADDTPDDSDAVADDTPDDSDTVDEDAIVEDMAPSVEISNLEAIENPASPLSFYVEWTTNVAAPTRLEVLCGGLRPRTYESETFVTSHVVLVAGLAPMKDCQFSAFTSLDDSDAVATTTEVSTSPLPEDMPVMTLNTLWAGNTAPGWTLFNLNDRHNSGPWYIVVVDELAEVRWWLRMPVTHRWSGYDVGVVDEGILFGGENNTGDLSTGIVGWDGELVWAPDFNAHHHLSQDTEDPNRYFYLWYSNECPAGRDEGTVNIWNRAEATSEFFWRICDHVTPNNRVQDWSHLNSIVQVPGENAILLSARHQSSIYRIDLETGEVTWALGAGRDFEIEDPFFQQHEPEILPNGNLLIFDNNGRGRLGYSRAIEYELFFDEAGEPDRAEVVWQYFDRAVFSNAQGDADRLSNGNTLLTYSQVEPGLYGRLVEATPNGEVAWQVTGPNGWAVYRSERIEPQYGWVVEAPD